MYVEIYDEYSSLHNTESVFLMYNNTEINK